MTTRCAATRRVEEDLSNAGVPPKGNHVPPEDNQVPPQNQGPVIPPPITYGYIRSTFMTLAQAMTCHIRGAPPGCNRHCRPILGLRLVSYLTSSH